MKKKSKIRLWLERKYGDDMPSSMQRGKWLFVFLMILPALVGLFVWYFGVNVQSLLLAFQDPNTGALSLVNFERLFADLTSGHSEILPAMLNTFKYFALSALILPFVTYFIAYFLYKKIRFSSFYAVMLYIPSIISSVVVTTMFKNLISPIGPISQISMRMGHGLLPNFLGQTETATKTILLFVFIFSLNGHLLLWMGTFKRIPQSIIDAAKIDGATETQELFYITTPMVSTTMVTLLILGFTGIFTASGPILFFTNGGANTSTISFWIFNQVYTLANYNYPAAVGIFFTLVGLPIVGTAYWLMNKIANQVEY